MGNLRLFRIWLLLGSVFMLFLIILYWDEVGNAGLHLRSSLPAPPLPLLPIATAGLPLASPRPGVVSTSTQLVTWTSEDKGYSFIWDTDAFNRAVMVDPDPPETRPTRHAAAVPSRAQQRPVPIPPEIVENPDVPESPETTVPPKQVLEPTPTQTRWSIPPTAVSTTTTTTNSPTTITPVAHGNPSSHPTQPPRRHNASVNTPGAPAVPVPPTAPFFSLLRRQAERRRQLQEACAENSGFDFPGKLRSFDQIPSQALDHLIVDDRHGIIYCYVPKVACTNWKRVMIVLGEKLVAGGGGTGGAGGGSDDPNAAPTPYRHPQDVPSELSHNGTLHLTFNKFWRRYGKASRSLMHAKLRKYTKFLFVRDPFVRLMSAFRNKLAQPNEDFYRQFSAHMLQRYANVSRPPSTAREAFKAGLRPSFGDFVRYLLDPETEKEEVFNEHWRQVYRLCHPCQIGYDFIGKLETLDEDADHLLHILDVDRQIQFPPGYRNRTAASWEQDWFANVPFEDRKKLYELYEPDFRLFGYPRPEALLHD